MLSIMITGMVGNNRKAFFYAILIVSIVKKGKDCIKNFNICSYN